MSLDIHTIVEIKDSQEGWFKALPESYNERKYIEDGKEESYISHNFDNGYYLSQNFEEYAMLADIYNSFGVEPIEQLRGIPVDASDVYFKLTEQLKREGHHHSYLYLRELKNLKTRGYWNKKITINALVPLDSYIDMKLKNKRVPDVYLVNGMIQCPSAIILSTDEEINLFLGKKESSKNVFVETSFEKTYLEIGSSLYELIELMTKKLEVERHLCHNCIRLCYFFS